MAVVGIIAEYNPLHLGHLYHINNTKVLYPDAGIICIMSGNFVQRGDYAIVNKNIRARAAVDAGADLVIELPLPYCLASAPVFAHSAVSMLEACGNTTHISFGSECGDINVLKKAALASFEEAFNTNVQEALSHGFSYAHALGSAYPPKLRDICFSPNNLLGIEYIRSLVMLQSRVEPITFKRKGAGHDSLELSKYASASAIRKNISNGAPLDILALPSFMLDYIKTEQTLGRFPVLMEAQECSIVSVLKRMSKEEMSEIPEISEGLENRLFEAAKTAATTEQLLSALKSKRYTLARARRILLSAYLGIKRQDQDMPPPYLRLLAVGKRGRSLLHSMKSTATLPIITKPAALKLLDDRCRQLALLEERADSLYSLAYSGKAARGYGDFFTSSPYIMPK